MGFSDSRLLWGWMFRLWIFLIAILFLAGHARAQPVEDLVHIRFILDVRVFAVMSAINSAGFDVDAGYRESSPTRRVVRERLQAMDPELLTRLRQFYRSREDAAHPALVQSRYISLALLLEGPPQFHLAVKPAEAPTEVHDLLGFEALVSEVWAKGNLARIWADVRGRYAAEIEAYRPLIRDMILKVLGYARTEVRISLDRVVHFIPDLLGSDGVVNARNLGETYIVVVGPSTVRTSVMRSIRHEYLHFLIDPLLAKYRGHLPEPEPFTIRVREQAGSLARYRENFRLMLAESLIQTMERRLDGSTDDRGGMDLITMYDQGLILAPYFDEALALFESRSESLQEFFPVMVAGLTWRGEKDRESQLARLREELERSKAEGQIKSDAEDLRDNEIRALLNAANQHLQSMEFEQAKAPLEKVLKLSEKNASALFGLAQIAAREQDLDKALGLYGRAAEAAGAAESWIAGWSCVHRGNIYRFLGELERARLEWARVLGLQGDLRGAREAAENSLTSNQPP